MINEIVIGHADARLVAQAILAAAGTTGRPIAVAVADGRGDIVYFTRQDGASAIDVRNSERKAYTAAFIGRDSSQSSKCAHRIDRRSGLGRSFASWKR